MIHPSYSNDALGHFVTMRNEFHTGLLHLMYIVSVTQVKVQGESIAFLTALSKQRSN